MNSFASYIDDGGMYITHYDNIGYLAIFFSVSAFLSLSKQKMRIYGGISTVLFGVSIFFYHGFNGLFVTIVSLASKLLSFYVSEDRLLKVKYSSFFLALTFYLFFNQEGYCGILPSISLVFIIFADMQKDILKMKYFYYGSAFSWLIYGVLLSSLPAILLKNFLVFLRQLGTVGKKNKD
jgi:hypothetical protein